MINMHYLNKAWLTIYLKQMKNSPKNKCPRLLIIAKNSDELKKFHTLYEEVAFEVFGTLSIPVPCYGMTEDHLKREYDLGRELGNFTDCLISQNFHDCLLRNYIIQNLRRNKK